MEPNELERDLEELETRVERLRALYEQYFMGIEKMEPQIPRKEVDRRIMLLRKVQIRNTALRFKFQMIIQRYNTMQQYWQRVTREIENGTYRRDVLRAAAKMSEKDALTILGKKRAKMYAKLLDGQKAARAGQANRHAEGEELSADDLVEETAGADAQPAGAGTGGASRKATPEDALTDGRAQVAAAAFRATAPAISEPPPFAFAPPAVDAAADWARAQIPPPPPSSPPTPAPTGQRRWSAIRTPTPSTPPAAAGASPGRPLASQPGAGAQVAVEAGKNRAAILAAEMKAERERQRASSTSFGRVELELGPTAAPAKPAPVPHPAPVPPAAPRLGPLLPPAAGATPRPGASSPTVRAVRPTIPAPVRPLPASPPVASGAAHAAPGAPAPRPAPGGAMGPPAAPYPGADPRAAPAPASRPSLPAGPMASRPPPAPAAPPVPPPGELGDDRVRQIYAKYVETKRAAHESTAGVTFDKLATSLRAQAAKIKASHPAKTVDYEVVIKDGKTTLKPVLR